jgi:nucleotide-binding universal stress UspA family protein
MTSQEIRPVVVGVDGTPQALRAVRIAARHAAARGVPLRIVHAADRSLAAVTWRQEVSDLTVCRLLDTAAAVARAEEPELQVWLHCTPGQPRAVLSAESETAMLLVIGHHRLGDRTAALLGSLGSRLAGRIGCPLLVVSHLGDRGGPVVVADDHPDSSGEVIREAFRQARTLGRPLQVVHAWHVPIPALAGGPAVYGFELVEATEQQTLVHRIAQISTDFPDVPVDTEATYGHSKPTLWDATEGAALLVVGIDGADRLRRVLHRPAPVGTLRHAMCPVLVVPGTGKGS